MKKILSCTLAVLLVGSMAYAVPYASLIRVKNTYQPVGTTQTISYVLNEAADSVTIDVLDGVTVIASFAGTAAQGLNEVAWDLTVDNAGGDPVDELPGLKVRIKVDADKAAGWAWAAINQIMPSEDCYPVSDGYWNEGANALINPRTLFTRFRGHSVAVPSNPDSDSFGMILFPSSDRTSSGWGTPNAPPACAIPHAALIVLNADLSIPAGSVEGGYDTRTLRHPIDLEARDGFQDVWYAVEDPLNPEYYFVSGQSALAGVTLLIYGHVSDYVGVDANPDAVIFGSPAPRTIAIGLDVSNERYIVTAKDNSVIERGTINAENQLVGPMVNLIGAGIPTDLYSKHVYFDSEGNLYWVSRDAGVTVVGGRAYRWPASVVQGATEAGSLTEANADWVITTTGINRLYEVTELPNGDMILACSAGFINLGAISEPVSPATVKTTELDENAVFFAIDETEARLNTYATGVRADPFGNLYFTSIGGGTVPDRRGFIAAMLSPGGVTSTTVDAPSSQSFRISSIPASAGTWQLYQ